MAWFVCFAPSILADGVFIPEAAVATMPRMPYQRSIIGYRDGVETLVVESSFETEGKTAGWILPLPSLPTEMRKVSPGL